MNPYERIKERLQILDLSQTDLGNHLGLGRSSISHAIIRQTGLEHRFIDIADFLKVSIDWLWRGYDPPAPPGEESGIYRRIIEEQESEKLALNLRLKQLEADYQRRGMTPPPPIVWPKPQRPDPDGTPPA